MPIYTKVNGSWKNITDVEVKNSVFNMVTKAYVKVNDQWKLFFSLQSDDGYSLNIIQSVQLPQPDVVPQPLDPLHQSNTIATITLPQPDVVPQPQDPLHQSNTIVTIAILTPTVV